MHKAAQDFSRGKALMQSKQFEKAEEQFAAAVELVPENAAYLEARENARDAAVTALLHSAAEDQKAGRTEDATLKLQRAQAIAPENPMVLEMIDQQAGAMTEEPNPATLPSGDVMQIQSGVLKLDVTPGLQNFHFRGTEVELLRTVFKNFGITAVMDASVPVKQTRMDVDDVTFNQAVQMAQLLTNTFYVPIDSRKVLLALDTKANRAQFERLFLETLYLPGLTGQEMQDASNLVKNIFTLTQVSVSPNHNTLTIRAPLSKLEAVNRMLEDLYQGHSQVMLNMTIYSVARTHMTNIGEQFPPSITAFNVEAEVASVINQNQALIQQLIAQGLVNPNDLTAIVALLIASGAVSNPVISGAFAVIGGGITETGLSTSGATTNLALNASDVHQLNKLDLRVGNNEPATLKVGTRYPIITSSYSNVAATTNPAQSTVLGSLLGTAGSSNVTNYAATPAVQYQDIGATIKATPRILKNNDINLALELTMTALNGASLNGIPVIDNREYKTGIRIHDGDEAVISSLLTVNEYKALTGIPGLNDIPGFPATNTQVEHDVSQIVVVLEPHIVRFDHPNGDGPMILLPTH